MAEQFTPAPDATVTAALPALPSGPIDGGHDWMDLLSQRDWFPLAGLGGRMIGDWPLVVVAFHTDRQSDRYGIAVYSEGTVSVGGYTSEEARNDAAELYCED